MPAHPTPTCVARPTSPFLLPQQTLLRSLAAPPKAWELQLLAYVDSSRHVDACAESQKPAILVRWRQVHIAWYLGLRAQNKKHARLALVISRPGCIIKLFIPAVSAACLAPSI